MRDWWSGELFATALSDQHTAAANRMKTICGRWCFLIRQPDGWRLHASLVFMFRDSSLWDLRQASLRWGLRTKISAGALEKHQGPLEAQMTYALCKS